jgi:signal transduction histidine kinase
MTESEIWIRNTLARRSPDQEILDDTRRLTRHVLLAPLIDILPTPFVVLNENRQIVMANSAFLKAFKHESLTAVCAHRLGEAMGCLHAQASHGGCEGAQACNTCGTVQAILHGQSSQPVTEECCIATNDVKQAFNLRVHAAPLTIDGRRYTGLSLYDIGDEKRRRYLERIFFHDVMNTAWGLVGFCELIKDADESEIRHYIHHLHRLSRQLVEEILAQKELVAAENGELQLHLYPVATLDLLEDLAFQFSSQEDARQKRIVIDPVSENVGMITDKTLLVRVMGNMIKNALEAVGPGETITIGCQKMGERVNLWVHNPVVIPSEVGLQIFKRSFSTKSTDRGLGTYSMKLLSERYLQGRVSFSSSPAEGTRFEGCFPLELIQTDN